MLTALAREPVTDFESALEAAASGAALGEVGDHLRQGCGGLERFQFGSGHHQVGHGECELTVKGTGGFATFTCSYPTGIHRLHNTKLFRGLF
jgi:hypothetical protein